ncbi:MAG: hypothetical protein GWO20_17075, partial [Candidatus Korarchaeota archaeon]|nr:hypothetical protein [Candidatus Korarchaeota archaeon]
MKKKKVEEKKEKKAELVMAVRDYECKDRKNWDRGVDFTASDTESDDKTLLRIITEPHTKSGIVGVQSVRDMIETIDKKKYDEGIAIGKKFSVAAKRTMREEGIEMVSEDFMPSFKPQKLYLKLQEYVDDLCKTKCGKVPKKESDCKGYSDGKYSCKIRL